MQVYMCDQCGAIIGDADEYVHVERNTYDDDGEPDEQSNEFCSYGCAGTWLTGKSG